MSAIRRLIRYQFKGERGEAELLSDGTLRVLSGAAATHLRDVTLLPPVSPSKIVGIGLNYRAHAAEMNKPLPVEPLMFLKPSTAVLPHGAAIVRPQGYERVDYEGELAVVFGKTARRVSEAEALNYVAGFCCFNDVTVRDLQIRDVQYTRAKGFDTFAPLGPAVVSGLDPANLRLITRVDGQVRQDSTTADMIFNVPQLIAAVTRVMTMLPGDIIATGTPPGVGQIIPGAVVEVEIEGIGLLRNPIVSE